MPQPIQAILDNEIVLDISQLDEEIIEEIAEQNSLVNEEKTKAKREQRYGWLEMPDMLALYERENDMMYLPRGFKHPLEFGLRECGFDIDWKDNRVDTYDGKEFPAFPLRPQQGPAAEALLKHQDGIYESPAGSGKTVTVLETIRRAQQARNLVIVPQIDIATQWAKECKEFMPDFPVGVIGEGRWDEQRLTVATQQTLHARYDELTHDKWWDTWGFSCMDECHHQQARTFMEVMCSIPSLYRVGVSATPDKTGLFEIAQAALGDIVHRTTRQELRDYGILARPRVDVIETSFYADYWPTHTAIKFDHCMKPGCPKSKKKRHFHRNNYSSVLKAMCNDKQRNRLIAWRAVGELEQGKRVLIDSGYKSHLRAIKSEMTKIGGSDNILWMTGNEDDNERQNIRETIHNEPCILLSTICREAVNIPRLDTVHLAFPISNPGTVRQVVGRVERMSPDKQEPIINDYYDSKIGVFANQFRKRRWEVYAQERYKVYRNGQEEYDSDIRE